MNEDLAILCGFAALILGLLLFRTVNMLMSTYWAAKALTLKAANWTANGVVVGLYTNASGALTQAVIDAGFGAGNIVEVTAGALTGYLRVTPTWAASTSSAGVGSISPTVNPTFTFMAVVTPTTISGWFMYDPTTNNMIFAQAETPVAITVPGTYTVGPFAIGEQAQ